MNTSLIQNKFLSQQEDLGVVAVGFSGGQASCQPMLHILGELHVS
jgi:arginase